MKELMQKKPNVKSKDIDHIMSLSLTASVVTVNQSKFENHFFQEKFLIYLTKLENSSGFNSINSMP